MVLILFRREAALDFMARRRKGKREKWEGGRRRKEEERIGGDMYIFYLKAVIKEKRH